MGWNYHRVQCDTPSDSEAEFAAQLPPSPVGGRPGGRWIASFCIQMPVLPVVYLPERLYSENAGRVSWRGYAGVRIDTFPLHPLIDGYVIKVRRRLPKLGIYLLMQEVKPYKMKEVGNRPVKRKMDTLIPAISAVPKGI